jgi:Mrp family chromosome partitioning ATPase
VTDILSGRITASEALHVGAGGTLRFLAAGAKSDPTPLTEDALRDLYNELGQTTDTDLVLISGPSVWSARVVSPMERAADGVVLVASDAQVAPEESVARARRILTNGYQPRLLGVIVGEETTKEPSALAAKSDTI